MGNTSCEQTRDEFVADTYDIPCCQETFKPGVKHVWDGVVAVVLANGMAPKRVSLARCSAACDGS